jgi:hypothetical protein
MNEASNSSQTSQPLSAMGEKIDALAEAIRETAPQEGIIGMAPPESRKNSTPPGRICTRRILIGW